MFIKKNYSSIKKSDKNHMVKIYIYFLWKKYNYIILHDKIWLSFDKHSGKIRKPGT